MGGAIFRDDRMASSRHWQRSHIMACTCVCNYIAKSGVSTGLPLKKVPPVLKNHDKTSAIISRSSPTQRVRANAASQGHPSLSQDPPNTPCTSNRVDGVHFRPWSPARHHQRIRHFFVTLSLRDHSHPFSSWEQRTLG